MKGYILIDRTAMGRTQKCMSVYLQFQLNLKQQRTFLGKNTAKERKREGKRGNVTVRKRRKGEIFMFSPFQTKIRYLPTFVSKWFSPDSDNGNKMQKGENIGMRK